VTCSIPGLPRRAGDLLLSLNHAGICSEGPDRFHQIFRHQGDLFLHPQYPLVAFYTHVQCRVPKEKRPVLIEYLTRANYGLWLGNFELDLRDGEILMASI
jgi:hypothetical protein